MKAVILTIGDEILIGQVVNSNAAYLGRELFSLGIPAEKTITVPDNEKEIINTLKASFRNYDIVIATGGLGPTHDDITKKCIAKFFKKKFILDTEVLKHVKEIFERRKIPMPPVNIAEALVTEGSVVLENKQGTAPGILIEKKGKIFCAMPGVPYEMEYICRTGLFPYLNRKYKKLKKRVIKQKTLHKIGIGESLLARRIGDINRIVKKGKDHEIKLAFLPSNYEVRLRITVSASSQKKAETLLKNAAEIIKRGAGKYIYSYSESSIQETVGKILLKKKLSIAAAESCTGGLITTKLTDIPGSSRYVMDGIVSYADKAKVKFLGVKKESIKKYGAVSRIVAMEMASGIRKRSNTDIGISATGIAGPSGARKNKPVGLVWIGYSDKNITFAEDL